MRKGGGRDSTRAPRKGAGAGSAGRVAGEARARGAKGAGARGVHADASRTRGGKPGAASSKPKRRAAGATRKHSGQERKPAKNAASAVASPCPVAGVCGGCSQIDVAYADQLAAKDAFIADAFAGAFASAELRPILGMGSPFHYRDKVTAPFAPGKRGPNGGREILSGMYAAGTHRIVEVEACLLENERAQQVVRAVKQLMRKHGMAPYDEDAHAGFVRHVVVRAGHESGEMLVTLVTNGSEFPASKSFCRELVRRCPFVTSVVQNVNLRQTNVILGSDERRLYGPGFILDTLCGLSFRISSQSFYQVNSTQTAVLYEQAIALAGLGSAAQEGSASDGRPGVVLDAYCGTGTIGLVAARRGARQVIGVDSAESSIRDARENARHNGVENARFVVADAGDFMQQMAANGQAVDVVIMDPPRAGASVAFLEALSALAPRRVVYVSCNPLTQVRDLEYLCKDGDYRVSVVQPVDMFPHTEHVESIALVERACG